MLVNNLHKELNDLIEAYFSNKTQVGPYKIINFYNEFVEDFSTNNLSFVSLVLYRALKGNKLNNASDLAIDLLAEFWKIGPILIPDVTNSDMDYIIAGALFRASIDWKIVEDVIHKLDQTSINEAKDNFWSDETEGWKWKEF